MAEESPRAARLLELVDLWNSGDHESIAQSLTEDAEIRTIRSELEGGAYIGPEGFRKAMADWERDWEYVQFVPGEYREREPFIVGESRVHTRGKTSGVELDVSVWMLWEFRGDRVSRLQSFSDRDEALRAAGIED